jgi:hypothetical protein
VSKYFSTNKSNFNIPILYLFRELKLAQALELAHNRYHSIASELEATKEAQMIVLETKESVMRSLAKQNSQLLVEKDTLSRRVEELSHTVEELATLLRHTQARHQQEIRLATRSHSMQGGGGVAGNMIVSSVGGGGGGGGGGNSGGIASSQGSGKMNRERSSAPSTSNTSGNSISVTAGSAIANGAPPLLSQRPLSAADSEKLAHSATSSSSSRSERIDRGNFPANPRPTSLSRSERLPPHYPSTSAHRGEDERSVTSTSSVNTARSKVYDNHFDATTAGNGGGSSRIPVSRHHPSHLHQPSPSKRHSLSASSSSAPAHEGKIEHYELIN